MEAIIKFIVICFISLPFMITVSCQGEKPILNVKNIPDHGTFNITCDASRVKFSEETPSPENSIITDLVILISTNGSKVQKTVASYNAWPGADYKQKFPLPGRDWIFNFNGSNNGSNNWNTMKIEIIVRDSVCDDAGTYYCSVKLLRSSKFVEEQQNVTAEAAVSSPFISLDPLNSGPDGSKNYSIYEVNDNVTMTCSVLGPEKLSLNWKRDIKPTPSVGNSIEDYQYQNDITYKTPEKTGSGVCQQFRHVSVLKYIVTERDKYRRYYCVVQEVSGESHNASVIIDLEQTITTPGSQSAASAGSQPSNVGLIVGVVVGSIAGIIIIAVIIGIVCYRRRRSKGGDNKEDTDRPDGGASQPDTYSVSSHDRRSGYPARDRQAHDDNEPPNKQQHHSDNHSRRKVGKPYTQAPYYDNLHHNEITLPGQRNHGSHQDDVHYAITDVSRSEDDSVDQLVSSKNTTSKPLITARTSKKKPDGMQLHYAQLDLPPSRPQRVDDADRRRIDMPTEYAEISV